MRDDYDYDDEPYVVIERNSGGVSSFLIGLAVGAGIALLLAPQSGMETRRQMKRRATRMRHAAEDAARGVRDTVSDTFEQARQRVEEQLDNARNAIVTKRRQVERAVDAGREAARQAREDLERRLAETKAAYNAGAQVAHEPVTESASGVSSAGSASRAGTGKSSQSRRHRDV